MSKPLPILCCALLMSKASQQFRVRATHLLSIPVLSRPPSICHFCVSRLPPSGAAQFHSAFQHFVFDHTGCIRLESPSSTFMTPFEALDATLAVKLALPKANALTGAAWCICTLGCCCCSPPEPPTWSYYTVASQSQAYRAIITITIQPLQWGGGLIFWGATWLL